MYSALTSLEKGQNVKRLNPKQVLPKVDLIISIRAKLVLVKKSHSFQWVCSRLDC